MKQIFDWLREQCFGNVKLDGNSFAEIYKIIDEAEAKWEAECCEWRLFTNTDYIAPTYETKCGKAIAEIRVSCNFAYCPVCGKPIKILEVE